MASVSRVTLSRAWRAFATGAASHKSKGQTMTEQTRSLQSEVTPPADPASTPSPTQTHYQQVAEQVIGALDAFTGAIPDFDSAHDLTKVFIRSKRNIPARFVSTAVGSLLVSPELQSVKQLDVNGSHDNTQYVDAFTPVLNALGTVFKGLQFTIDIRKARLATEAQKIYKVAQGLAQDRNGATVGAHVENMKRARKPRQSRAKSKKQPSPAPAPATTAEGTGGVTQK